MSNRDMAPAEIARMMAGKSAILVDVREPAEYAAERIHGALLFPLSTFDPTALPVGPVILQCGSGIRSRRALDACEQAGVAVAGHMKGGIQAWKAAGLPVVRIEPETGRIIDNGKGPAQ